MTKEDLQRLALRWLGEAAQHQSAADEIGLTADDLDDEERLLHLEAARVYRLCADGLLNLELDV
jgi:hypothetical protein